MLNTSISTKKNTKKDNIMDFIQIKRKKISLDLKTDK